MCRTSWITVVSTLVLAGQICFLMSERENSCAFSGWLEVPEIPENWYSNVFRKLTPSKYDYKYLNPLWKSQLCDWRHVLSQTMCMCDGRGGILLDMNGENGRMGASLITTWWIEEAIHQQMEVELGRWQPAEEGKKAKLQALSDT